MEHIETIITLRTYRSKSKEAFEWLAQKEREGFTYEESEMTNGKQSVLAEADLRIVVTKLEPFETNQAVDQNTLNKGL